MSDLINQVGLYDSFKGDESCKDKLRTVPSNTSDTPLFVSGKELVCGVDYDQINATYPTAKTEHFVYSLTGTPVQTILIEYLTASKKDILSVVFS